jgi:hypothetical protein
LGEMMDEMDRLVRILVSGTGTKRERNQLIDLAARLEFLKNDDLGVEAIAL